MRATATKHWVVDTNVLVSANGRDTHASPECQLRCAEFLQAVIKGDIVVLDDDDKILNEYNTYINFGGEPGIGDYFFRYLFNHKYDQNRVILVHVIALPNGSYEEFPDDLELNGFDIDDHKYVAVSIAHSNKSSGDTEIAVALDSDWSNYHQILSQYVGIQFLCPEHVAP